MRFERFVNFTSSFLLGGFLLSCAMGAEQIDQKMYDTHMTQDYQAPKEKCFQATKAAFKSLKIPVKNENMKDGIIVTEKAVMEEIATTTGSASGSGYSASYSGNTRVDRLEHKFYMKVEGNKSSCTVKATRYQVWLNNQEGTQVNVRYAKSRFWQPLFQAIGDELEDAKVSQR